MVSSRKKRMANDLAFARATWKQKFQLRVKAMRRLLDSLPEDMTPTPSVIGDDE